MWRPNLHKATCICGSLVLLFSILSCSSSLPSDVQEAYSQLPEKVDYNFHIKPILSDRCYQCHGPDENTRKGGLRLDLEDEAFNKLKSGNHALVKRSASRSEAIKRLVSDDPEYQMPPPESELQITNQEIAMIAKWLEQGAEWKPHWSLIKVKRPDVPPNTNDWGGSNPIDNFIHAKLLETGLEPNPMADKERLLRRVTMDLTGLPPSIEEIDDFLNDQSPNAYEKVVDRLLTSTSNAERLTMEWMDVARYADSHGVSFDGYRNSWPYREWVIEAFRKNMPYSEFITHQVAGDLMEGADEKSQLATAFYRLNPLESSQGSIDEEFRAEYVGERTGTTGTAFLGLTVECARCHDHKFDPISQKEYFQLSAFFNTTEEMGLGPIDADRAPTLLLYEDEEKRILDSLDVVIDNEQKSIEQKKQEITDIKNYITKLNQVDPIPGEIGYFTFDKIKPFKKEIGKRNKKKKKEYKEIQILDNNEKIEAKLGVTLVEGHKGKAAFFDDEYDFISLREIGEFDHSDAFSISTWINTKKSDKDKGATQTIVGNSRPYIAYYRGWDLSLDSTNRVKVRLIHRLPDDFIEVVSSNPVHPDDWIQIGFTYDGSRYADGVTIFINGEKVKVDILTDKLKRSIIPITGFSFKPDTLPLRVGKSYRSWTFDGGIFKGAIDEIKIFDRQLSQLEMAYIGNMKLDVIPESLAREHAVLHNKNILSLCEKLKSTRKARSAVLDSVKEIMVMEEMENPRKTYLLERGLYNQHGEEVDVGTPAHVLPFSADYPKNRLGLAQWLTHPDNPLVSRVAINRYWQMIFGRGLVKTAENFGSQGERPSHPELLDWLSAEFIESNWNLRHMLKLMVMSSTYRQSSVADPKLFTADPENKFLARSNSYRWPAEVIRDNALAASGLLYQKIGGPSVKPYQPEGLWDELGQTSYVLSKYKQDSTDNLYRRSMYTFMRRFSPHPFFTTFDATAREICMIRRDITDSPLQALILLNDPQIVEASRILSERIQVEACEKIEDQLTYGFRLATGLQPTEKQLSVMKDQFIASVQHFESNPTMADSILSIGLKPWNGNLDKTKTAALAMVANTILNHDDTYMKR